MSGSVEIVLWLHEYEFRALKKQLASNGTDVEKRMQEMLADLYSECVPSEERQAIQELINAEHAEAVADQMAKTTWAAYHVTGRGEDLYFKTSSADTLLIAAKRLRTYLTAGDSPLPVSFASVFKDRSEITQAEYDQLLDQRLQNTGKVSGVFEMDFDKDTFSAANAMDGWHTYRIHDVSVAAYHAFRKQNISMDQRWDRLLDKLEGKELTPNSEAMVLTGSRRLSMNEISFQDDMSECGSLLNFYVPVTFDPDAVFGTNVATDANDDYLNVYAEFDLDVGEVCDALTVIQVCGDGSEETYRYPLTEEDRSILRSKMNDYCMEQTGLSLDDYRAQYLDEEMCASSFPDGQSM
ncbi:hypothetical protein [Pseudoflavonifractor sp. MCC625]|uniref:hypothetical protein n=1 Tax=Pseudoflavonifractor sp. MCC625 TaxID=2592647 RepID=UPI001C01257E|nr:hypothetical protein [Pseudoflavonifractor sp. MCC625]MBT9683465.1 hypothetical protein [Pseudoflavonifractor sp. MCC625]